MKKSKNNAWFECGMSKKQVERGLNKGLHWVIPSIGLKFVEGIIWLVGYILRAKIYYLLNT